MKHGALMSMSVLGACAEMPVLDFTGSNVLGEGVCAVAVL